MVMQGAAGLSLEGSPLMGSSQPPIRRHHDVIAQELLTLRASERACLMRWAGGEVRVQPWPLLSESEQV